MVISLRLRPKGSSGSTVFDAWGEQLGHAEWDPGFTKAVLVGGDGPGPDSDFDVTVKSPGRDLTLRYVTAAAGLRPDR